MQTDTHSDQGQEMAVMLPVHVQVFRFRTTQCPESRHWCFYSKQIVACIATVWRAKTAINPDGWR